MYFMTSGQRVEDEYPSSVGPEFRITIGPIAKPGVANGSATLGAEVSQLKIADWRDGSGGERHGPTAFLGTPAAGHRPGVTACSRPLRLPHRLLPRAARSSRRRRTPESRYWARSAGYSA